MSFATLLLLAFAMSTDAFAASLCKGTNLKAPRLINALKIGLIFGITEAIAPVIGWLLGSAGEAFIEQWDHWIAFGLLSALGLHMIKASFEPDDDDTEPEPAGAKKTLAATMLTAVGTSIDALAIGVSFAFLKVNILLAAAMIGAATTLMVTIGVLLGHRLGVMVGKKAEALGGSILILVGSWILYSHLTG